MSSAEDFDLPWTVDGCLIRDASGKIIFVATGSRAVARIWNQFVVGVVNAALEGRTDENGKAPSRGNFVHDDSVDRNRSTPSMRLGLIKSKNGGET